MPRRGSHIAILLALSSATMLTGCTKSSSQHGRRPATSTPHRRRPSPTRLCRTRPEVGGQSRAISTRGWPMPMRSSPSGRPTSSSTSMSNWYKRNPGNIKLAEPLWPQAGGGRPERARPSPFWSRPPPAARLTGASTRRWAPPMTSRDSIRRRGRNIEKALAADPQNLSVLNNLGMSYALEGNLKQAEATLRQADALPRSKSEPRIRQNLALVVGPAGPLRRGQHAGPRGPAARAGGGQHGLSPEDAVPAQYVAADQRRRARAERRAPR